MRPAKGRKKNSPWAIGHTVMSKKGLSTNLIFWIVMGYGIAHFSWGDKKTWKFGPATFFKVLNLTEQNYTKLLKNTPSMTKLVNWLSFFIQNIFVPKTMTVMVAARGGRKKDRFHLLRDLWEIMGAVVLLLGKENICPGVPFHPKERLLLGS